MPPKKGKVGKKKGPRTSEEDDHLLDAQYNPEIIENMLHQLEQNMEIRCKSMQSDTEFMIYSIQKAFQLELVKLPKTVQQMSVKQFRDEFGDSLDAVTKGAMVMKMNNTVNGNIALKENKSHKQVFQTPSHKGFNPSVMQTPSQRNPREGEVILSANGSPLGEFMTVKKAPRNGANVVIPPTPGVFVPISKTGEVVDLESLDVDEMDEETKADTIGNIQDAMSRMQALMAKLQPSR